MPRNPTFSILLNKLPSQNDKAIPTKKWNFVPKFIKKQHKMKTKAKNWMVIAVSLLCACSNGKQSASFERSVCLTQPEAVSKVYMKNFSGIVKEAHNINLGFKTAGQIAHIDVQEGDFVRRGQLLAELDDADYLLAVEALQIQYDQLQDEVRRTKRLLEQKSISINDYEKATAGLKQLGVQLQANQNKLNYTKLYAPTDGYIQQVNFSTAEMVDAGTAVFSLLDLSRMEVTVDIPGNIYRQRQHFLRFNCRAAGISEQIPLALQNITPKADGNQLYRMCLAFKGQPDRRLTAGTNVEVEITLTDSTALTGFALPFSAVFRDQDTSCVWVFQPDSTVTKRAVTLGPVDEKGRAIIVDGLTGEEQIVRAGVNSLLEGEKVEVIVSPSKTNVGGVL